MLSASYEQRVVYLNSSGSTNELKVTDYSFKKQSKCTTTLQAEPSAVVIGATHVATYGQKSAEFLELLPPLTARPDAAYIYRPQTEPAQLSFTGETFSKSYDDTIKHVELGNGYAMCLTENGVVYLHPLNRDYFTNAECGVMSFPDNSAEGKITAATLTNYFLIYATSLGAVIYISLTELTQINHFSHGKVITHIHAQPGNGTKIILVDEESNSCVYCPIINQTVAIKTPSGSSNAMWEITGKKPVFVTWSNSVVTTHVYANYTLKGPQCYPLSVTTMLPFGFKPLIFKSGTLVCQNLGGRLDEVDIKSHTSYTPEKFIQSFGNENEQGKAMKLMYVIGRYDDIWSLYPLISSIKPWVMLAESALHALDIEFAKRVYRQIGNVAMVMTLDSITDIEDRLELTGHVAVIFGDFAFAHQCFLTANPRHALNLKIDLCEYDAALYYHLTLVS
jgi:WD repeat-containing protein 19